MSLMDRIMPTFHNSQHLTNQPQKRGTVIAEDTGELVQLGRKQRRRDSDAESTRGRSRGFTGSQALEQYLLALQLILRKQVSWLITVANFPTDLEVRSSSSFPPCLLHIKRKRAGNV